MMSIDILFRPFNIGTPSLENRILTAPMTRGFARDGLPATPHANYYRRRAEGEVGLILSDAPSSVILHGQ